MGKFSYAHQLHSSICVIEVDSWSISLMLKEVVMSWNACLPNSLKRPLRHSRSFKVTDFSTNRKLIYDFLLVINTNLPPILHHLRVMVKFLLARGEYLTFTLSIGAIPCQYRRKRYITKTWFFVLHFRCRKYRCIFNHFYIIRPERTRFHFGEIKLRLGLLRRSRSFKVIDFGTNRTLTCDLVINSNLPPILHRFRDIASERSKIAIPLLCLTRLTEGFPWDNLCKILPGCRQMANVLNGVEKLRKISIAWVGCTNVTDDRRQTTDRQMDGRRHIVRR